MKRTLSLKREALTPLTTDEIAAVGAAGTTPPWLSPRTLDPQDCFATTQDSVLICRTWDSMCSC